MAQDIGHVFEARTMVDHLGGSSMPEEMARDARRDGEARVCERLPYHPPHRTFRQRLERQPTAQKDLATRTRRPSALQVGHHGLSHVVRQGYAARPATAGSWRLERWRQADSWPTKAVIMEARRDDQSGVSAPKQAVMKRLTIRR